MAVTVYIPTPFRRVTQNRDRVSVAAADVGGVLDALERAHPGLRGLVRGETGEVHHHVNVYVNARPIEELGGLGAPVADGDEVTIIPALAGGSATLSPDELRAIVGQAEREYPHESCGVILSRGGERRLVACRNVQDELHGRDPDRHPRDARTAYYIDPGDLLAIGRLEGDGFAVAVIYHSHVDAGAYFSETDRRQALVGGEPAYPDATYVVTSVIEGRARAVAAFRWGAGQREFEPVDLGVDPGILTEGR